MTKVVRRPSMRRRHAQSWRIATYRVYQSNMTPAVRMHFTNIQRPARTLDENVPAPVLQVTANTKQPTMPTTKTVDAAVDVVKLHTCNDGSCDCDRQTLTCVTVADAAAAAVCWQNKLIKPCQRFCGCSRSLWMLLCCCCCSSSECAE